MSNAQKPITVDTIPTGQFGDYRKTATTRISEFTIPAGTVVQSPEGPVTAYEESRIVRSQDGIYLIAESTFRATYERAAHPIEEREPRIIPAVQGG